ncbi:uncharacterized protein L203_102976 [Cryptococcus depauperatus CBS 7841]|uniref:Uncharacterized protein n=1 Tax=Cryptococcus depauperatus CBS 7841 TaxID=1295531 RepID=A0A1E3IQE2_9TREE|nr:hypothetical protein L203_01756 [Cryptococcus depauperatus CBS 7841]
MEAAAVVFAKETQIAGFNETAAAALFAKDATFLLRCQMASLIIDTFLAGVLAVQVFTYFQYQRNDKWWTKLVVGWSCTWTFVITVYYWVYISYLFINNFGLWLPWLEVRWLAKMPTFDVLAIVPVQGFFAYRAYLLTNRNRYILAILILLLMAAFGGGVGVTAVFGGQSSLLGANKSGPTLITWTATTTAADVLIAGCILYGLLKSKTGWAHTDKLVSRLVRLVFEAQLPPTFLALAYCIEWSQTPSSLLGAVFQCLQSKAYCVGLLYTLNSRISFSVGLDDARSHHTPQIFGNSRRPTDGIQIDVQTYIHGDSYVLEESKGSHKHDKTDSLSDQEATIVLENHSRSRLTGSDAV